MRKTVFGISDSDTNRAERPQILDLEKERGCTICVMKTKTVISCAVIVLLIYAFVFAYSKKQVFYDAAQFLCE